MQASARKKDFTGEMQPPAPRDSVLVDLSAHLAKLARHGVKLAKAVPLWNDACL